MVLVWYPNGEDSFSTSIFSSILALNPCITRCSCATKVGEGRNTPKKFSVYVILALPSNFHSHGRLPQGNYIKRRMSAYAITMVSSLRPRHCLGKPE